jgi:hypothetical protein
MFCRTHTWKQVKMHKIKKKAQNRRHIFRNMQTREMEEPTDTFNWTEAPPWRRTRPNLEPTRARQWRVRPARVRPYLGCAHTPSAASWADLTLAVAWRCVEAVPYGFHIYQHQTVITPL